MRSGGPAGLWVQQSDWAEAATVPPRAGAVGRMKESDQALSTEPADSSPQPGKGDLALLQHMV